MVDTPEALEIAYESADGAHMILHRGGVPWDQAPVPSRFHHCKTQTKRVFYYFSDRDFCACGAERYNNGSWKSRNSRRKSSRMEEVSNHGQ